MNLLIETHYLPCIEYFVKIQESEKVYIEACENYQKQSYRNRCLIKTTNKIDQLTVPVLRGNSKILIREVRIDPSLPWNNVHWKSISSAYGKAPYFEYYADYFKRIYDRKHQFLFDLNMEFLTLCLKLLKIDKKVEITQDYNQFTGSNVDYTSDKRSLIHPKKAFEISDIKYQQVFGNIFEPNLSILDILFCEGNNSQLLIRDAVKK